VEYEVEEEVEEEEDEDGIDHATPFPPCVLLGVSVFKSIVDPEEGGGGAGGGKEEVTVHCCSGVVGIRRISSCFSLF
jgi:hypothetical protein